MNWIEQLNQSMEYIESNLDKTIDMHTISRIAGCSPYHYQRMFSLVAEITLGEYIRKRRLTMAAYELQDSGVSVIETALKYGYESPTAFTRAFSKFHGVTPRQAKKAGVSLKAYPKLSFEIAVNGRGELNYRIEKKQGFRFVGIKETVYNDGVNNFIRVPRMWQEARENGMIEDIFKLSDGRLWGVMGALANYTQDTVDYYIVATSDEAVPDDMVELYVEEGLWVIFPCHGRKNIQPVWKRIYGEWFPGSGYEHSGGVEVEWYSDGDLDADDYLTEIWIPIKEGKKHGTFQSDFDKEERAELSAGQGSG